MKDTYKNILALGAGCAAAFLVLEAFLAFYPPLASRVRGGRIILFPYKRYVVENDRFPSLERRIVRTNNSLGFRGAEPPKDFSSYLTVVAVGGSTTECFYLSDGKSWPERLQPLLARSYGRAWVNNAGMDGHSTFGHLALMREYICALRPGAVIFLTGLNDMGLGSASRFDRMLTGNEGRSLPAALFVRAASVSRVAALAQNIYLHSRAIKAGLVHAQLDLKAAAPLRAPAGLLAGLKARHAPFAAAYAERLGELARVSRAAGIRPVFATQPLLCGKGRDPRTGADLELLPTGDEFVNCGVKWAVLEVYNDAARRKAAELKVPLADLAREMPKDSLYFYDYSHFTGAGTEKVAENVWRDAGAALAGRGRADGR